MVVRTKPAPTVTSTTAGAMPSPPRGYRSRPARRAPRAGHGIAVLVRRHAEVVHGSRQRTNEQAERALSADEDEEDE